MRKLLVPTVLFLTLLLALPAVANEGFKTWYTVKRGDTLSEIAAEKDVTIREIKRWNRLRNNRIRVGQKLMIYSLTPERPTRIVEHRIKRGDSLIKIAKQYGTTVKDLKRLNRMRRVRLIAGKTIKVEVPGPENPSVATGRPQFGRLENGERLPKGPGYIIKSPAKAYGTNHTITMLMTTIPKVKKKWRHAPDVVVGDLSKKHGGHFPPHRSHQNGLDVDIGYYFKEKPHPTHFKRATAKTLDVEKTWFLLKAFIDTGMVDYIFVDYTLQEPLYEHAKKQGASKRFLRDTFQFPRGRGVGKGLIRHSPSHKNHFHIRFNEPERTTRDEHRPRGQG